ncbi:MAG: MFS transporter [Burkholderiales bacterium]|nr:MFS transporter [Burkholderiales bacterium]MDE2160474.1 MFS transporter [Burkholderiales bacterium]MDE2501765.1 MFS transporter [Burkholderiales bacterium]
MNTSALPAVPIRNEAAPAAADGTRNGRVPVGVVAATVAGNALEFYDFVTYAYFAVYIGKTFFPAATPLGSLLLAVGVFGVGFFARPVGGVLIGAFADRAGRRPAMMLTIALITVGTLGLALTPSYQSIGLAAPIIVVLCRLVQGLALGGEVGPSSAFLIEAAPAQRRGIYASWQLASQGIAGLVAGLMGLAMTRSLGPAEMLAWGWRVPFLVGLLLVPLALYLRHHMPETLHAKPVAAVNSGMVGIRRHRGLIALAVLVIIGGTVSTYLGIFMTTYAITTLKLTPATAMGATVVGGLCTFVFSLVGGWLCDRYGRRPAMFWPRVAAALLTVPAFAWLVASPGAGVLFAVSGFLAALTAVSGAASLIAIPELLPRGIRATGMSIAYAVGVALFGGTTQLVITWLIGVTGNPAAPAWYAAGASVVTALAMLAMPESRQRALED